MVQFFTPELTVPVLRKTYEVTAIRLVQFKIPPEPWLRPELTSHLLDPFNLTPQDRLERFHQRVREPLREFMEGDAVRGGGGTNEQ